MYHTDFEVKYKTIENEIKSKEDWLQQDSEYHEEFEILLDQLFRHELSQVLEIEDIDNFDISFLLDIWKNISQYIPFHSFFRDYQTTYFPYGFTDENIFISLFQYDLFYVLHPCICEFLQTQQVGEEKIQKLRGCL